MKVSCPAGRGRLQGTPRSRWWARPGRDQRASARRGRAPLVKLATKKIKVAAGKTKTVKAHLSRRGRTLLTPATTVARAKGNGKGAAASGSPRCARSADQRLAQAARRQPSDLQPRREREDPGQARRLPPSPRPRPSHGASRRRSPTREAEADLPAARASRTSSRPRRTVLERLTVARDAGARPPGPRAHLRAARPRRVLLAGPALARPRRTSSSSATSSASTRSRWRTPALRPAPQARPLRRLRAAGLLRGGRARTTEPGPIEVHLFLHGELHRHRAPRPLRPSSTICASASPRTRAATRATSSTGSSTR